MLTEVHFAGIHNVFLITVFAKREYIEIYIYIYIEIQQALVFPSENVI